MKQSTFLKFFAFEIFFEKLLTLFFRCAICWEVIENDQTVREIHICGHIFHDECIEKWLKVKEECPMCKLSITPQSLNEGGNYNVLAPLEPEQLEQGSSSSSSTSNHSLTDSEQPEQPRFDQFASLNVEEVRARIFRNYGFHNIRCISPQPEKVVKKDEVFSNLSEDWNFKPLEGNFYNDERTQRLFYHRPDDIIREYDLLMNELNVAREGDLERIMDIEQQLTDLRSELNSILTSLT